MSGNKLAVKVIYSKLYRLRRARSYKPLLKYRRELEYKGRYKQLRLLRKTNLPRIFKAREL